MNARYNEAGYNTIYGSVGKDKDGFAVFATYAIGWLYLVNTLKNAVTGKSKVYTPNMTLVEFFAKYAPSSDGNDPKSYAEAVAKKMGVDSGTKISTFA
jgi:hypothetical protein